MNRFLRRYQAQGYRRHDNILAVDFENRKDGSFICAGVYGDVKGFGKIDEYFIEQAAFDEFIMRFPKSSCIIVTFNLSYDRWYFENVVDHSTVLANSRRVFTAKLRSGLKIYDLTNHVTAGKLEDWIEYLDMTALFGIRKAKLSNHKARVMNDARATYVLGHWLQDFYNFECGISLTITIGAAAMRIFTKYYFRDYWERDDDELCRFERRAYHGGRVELFRRGRIKTWGYDVNGTYVSLMRDCQYPDPLSAVWYREPAKAWFKWRDLIRDKLGIWHCRVRTPPDMWLPVLPVWIDGKLKFPIGEFDGEWTSVDLNLALEMGYTLVEVYKYVIYHKSKPYLRAFADFVWSKRIEYRQTGNTGMDLLVKLLGNNLHGKFAQRNHAGYFGRLEDFQQPVEDGMRVFNYHGELWVESIGELTPASFEFPCISAFVTAYAREKLYRAMLANVDTLIYCDTDSVKLTAPARDIDIGEGLGQWGIEVKGKELEYHRPKLYGDIRKGVPKRAVQISADAEGETYIYDKPLHYREAILAGKIPNTWVACRKVLLYDDDKREWIGDDSKPLTVNE